MPKHARTLSDEQLQRLERNRATLRAALSGGQRRKASSMQSAPMHLTLERFVIDRDTGAAVPFEGARGVERLLAELAGTFGASRLMEDGRLVGMAGRLRIEEREEEVTLRVRVGAGAQLRVEVGPAVRIGTLLDALDAFRRQAHLASRALGRNLELVAQGYNPAVSSPSDVVLVPTARNALTNTYLARTGTLARDALRCCAATTLRLPLQEEGAATETYQLLCALSPVLAFLTDNTPRLRGAAPDKTPRMARALVWEQVDPARCGLVPHTFEDSFGFDAYERWVEGLEPILFTSDDGVSFATGTDTCADLMSERELSPREARRILRTALPTVAWDGRLVLRAADALPPRLAGGYAALVRGLLATEDTRAAARALLQMPVTATQVADAWRTLRMDAWDARVFGRPVTQVTHELTAIADRGLAEREERRLLAALSQLWEVHAVPRDLAEGSWERMRPRSGDEMAAELWGEGAVIPYDELEGDPPAGQTAVMRLSDLGL